MPFSLFSFSPPSIISPLYFPAQFLLPRVKHTDSTPSGTGASSIYPLLACATRSRWRLIATDIDAKNLEFAERNIALNNLQNRIRLYPSTPEGPLIPLDNLGIDR